MTLRVKFILFYVWNAFFKKKKILWNEISSGGQAIILISARSRLINTCTISSILAQLRHDTKYKYNIKEKRTSIIQTLPLFSRNCQLFVSCLHFATYKLQTRQFIGQTVHKHGLFLLLFFGTVKI